MKGQQKSYSLPNEITEKAIESVWDVAEKVAEFAGVTPEVLLEGGWTGYERYWVERQR